MKKNNNGKNKKTTYNVGTADFPPRKRANAAMKVIEAGPSAQAQQDLDILINISEMDGTPEALSVLEQYIKVRELLTQEAARLDYAVAEGNPTHNGIVQWLEKVSASTLKAKQVIGLIQQGALVPTEPPK